MSKWVTPEKSWGSAVATKPKEIPYDETGVGRVNNYVDESLAPVFKNYDLDVEQVSRGDTTPVLGPIVRAAGLAGQAVGGQLEKPFGLAADAVSATTNPLSKAVFNAGMGHIAQGIEDSAVVKWMMKKAEENPGYARDMVAGLQSLDLLGARHLGGKHINNTLDNIITKLEGFYESPQGAVTAFAREGTQGTPNAVIQSVSPQAIANREAKGTGQTRINEAVNSKNQSEVDGSLMASSFIPKQAENRTGNQTLIEKGPTAQLETLGTTRWDDKEGVKNLLTSELKTPEELPEGAVDWFMDSTERALGPQGVNWKSPMSIMKGAVPKLTNIQERPVGETIFNVRNRNSGVGELSQEAIGVGSTGSFVQRRLRNGGYDKYIKQYGQEDNFESFADYIKTASAFEKGGWENMGGKNLGYGSQAGAMAEYLKRKDTPLDDLSPKQRKLVEAVDANKNPNWVVDPKNQTIKYATNYLSSAKDLGGVGFRGLYDYKNGNSYTSVIDGHDMFGANPVGGSPLWNSTAIQQTDLRGGREKYGSRGDREEALLDKSMKEMEELTGMPPKSRVQKNNTKSHKKGDVVPTESPFQYQKRLLRDWNAPVEARHRLEAAKGQGLMASSAVPASFGEDAQTTAGGLPTGLMNPESREAAEYLMNNPQALNVRGKNTKPFLS